MLESEHRIHFADARDLDFIPDRSIDLVVTSPPYPMIEMWDRGFQTWCPQLAEKWDAGDGRELFEFMHRELDRVWSGLYRVLREGGFACINIGDATRSFGGGFCLYPNHARVLKSCMDIGFNTLPLIHWRKPTNAPTKFMGSGMLPAGAYVTLEHEYILILRKGGVRRFRDERERENRRRSALFWEERNHWYADVWDIIGVRQLLARSEARKRSGAFPFEIAYRLINMYSVRGDRVLDPFLGTGTTVLAAVASCRNSAGVEVDPSLEAHVRSTLANSEWETNRYISDRLKRHIGFVADCVESGKRLKHTNRHYGFPVMTGQERELMLNFVKRVELPSGEASPSGSGPFAVRATYFTEPSLVSPDVAQELSLFSESE
jgi:DNA modification methylase